MNAETLIPKIGVVTDIRVDTPDIKTFRVVGMDGKKVFEHKPGQCAMPASTSRDNGAGEDLSVLNLIQLELSSVTEMRKHQTIFISYCNLHCLVPSFLHL